MHRLALLALLSALAATAVAAEAACTSTPSCLAAIQHGQKDTRSFTADFVQVKHVSLLDEPLVSRGRMSFQRPDRMRLEITEPVQAVVLINGREVKIPGISEKDAKAMSMGPVAGMFTQLGALFSGDTAALQKGFDVTARANAAGDGVDVVLVPREESWRKLFRHIDLHFTGSDMLAREIRLEDGFGDHLEVKLENVQRNVALPSDQFGGEAAWTTS